MQQTYEWMPIYGNTPSSTTRLTVLGKVIDYSERSKDSRKLEAKLAFTTSAQDRKSRESESRALVLILEEVRLVTERDETRKGKKNFPEYIHWCQREFKANPEL